MRNNRRYDLSDRLTHFFRNIDLEADALDTPEVWGEASIAENTKLSAFFLMRCAIRHGHLWATWAKRGGVRTIYGTRPATCFTDMPTAAFLETAATRRLVGEKISSFALTFSKTQMHAMGARPVIYGLSDESVSIPSGSDGGVRMIPSAALPEIEQYRYVTYAPMRVDWTHEREWRLPFTGSLDTFEREMADSGLVCEVTDVPGISLYKGGLSNIGAIVKTKADAEKMCPFRQPRL